MPCVTLTRFRYGRFTRCIEEVKMRTVTAWKVSKYGVFSGPYFPALGLNTESYGVPLRIQSESAEMRTKKNSVFRHFSRSEFWIKNWFLIWGIFGIFDSYTDIYRLLFSLIFIFLARAPSLQAIMVFTYFPTKRNDFYMMETFAMKVLTH